MAVRQDDLIDAKNKAQLAVFAAIEKEAADVDAANVNSGTKAAIVRDLALAYRFAAGGSQPGSIHVEK